MEGCAAGVHAPVLPQTGACAHVQPHSGRLRLARMLAALGRLCPMPQFCRRPVGPTKGAAREEVRRQELGDAGTGL